MSTASVSGSITHVLEYHGNQEANGIASHAEMLLVPVMFRTFHNTVLVTVCSYMYSLYIVVMYSNKCFRKSYRVGRLYM